MIKTEHVRLFFRIVEVANEASSIPSMGQIRSDIDRASMDLRVVNRLSPLIQIDPQIINNISYGGHIYPGTEFMIGVLEGIENAMDELSFYDY